MVTYNFPTIVKGDTFDGILFTIIVNGSPLDLTDAHILMSLKLTSTGAVTQHFSSDNGDGITISSPVTDGKFVIDAQTISFAAATYRYNIKITLSNGIVKTYVGGSWKILQDVTYA